MKKINESTTQNESKINDKKENRVKSEIRYYLYGELFIEPYSEETYRKLVLLSCKDPNADLQINQLKTLPSKCFDCRYANAKDCLKIAIGAKSGLELFPFINVAIQVINDDGSLESFYIADCVDFKHDKPRVNQFKNKKSSLANNYNSEVDNNDNEFFQKNLSRKRKMTPYYSRIMEKKGK